MIKQCCHISKLVNSCSARFKRTNIIVLLLSSVWSMCIKSPHSLLLEWVTQSEWRKRLCTWKLDGVLRNSPKPMSTENIQLFSRPNWVLSMLVWLDSNFLGLPPTGVFRTFCVCLTVVISVDVMFRYNIAFALFRCDLGAWFSFIFSLASCFFSVEQCGWMHFSMWVKTRASCSAKVFKLCTSNVMCSFDNHWWRLFLFFSFIWCYLVCFSWWYYHLGSDFVDKMWFKWYLVLCALVFFCLLLFN